MTKRRYTPSHSAYVIFVKKTLDIVAITSDFGLACDGVHGDEALMKKLGYKDGRLTISPRLTMTEARKLRVGDQWTGGTLYEHDREIVEQARRLYFPEVA